MLEFFLIIFSSFFSSTIASHFLGGSFTYRHIQRPTNNRLLTTVLVELRFHISNHYFICTPEQVNEHLIVYLIGEPIPYDQNSKKYLWNTADAVSRNPKFYDIECFTKYGNTACDNFIEKTWGYCESANSHSGYSILRRQFFLVVENRKPIQLEYSACCWADSLDKRFHFNLSITTKPDQINSSPYPHIPASYYVDMKQRREITIFVYDADGDEILCQRYENDLNGFLTVHVDSHCKLIYQANRAGKQFGQFWLMDRRNKEILSSSLISIQVHVLEGVTCRDQPEIFVKRKQDQSSKSTIKISESVYISVSLKPNCPTIQPQDQTITELTTLCNNNQPVVLANGGIEVLFQCTPYLCKKYQVCFVGEFSLRLSSTKTECVLIEVTGTENECANAAKNHDFLKPRNRQFVMSEPIKDSVTGKIPTAPSTSKLYSKTTTATATSLAQPQSRRWLWILIIFFFFFVLGFMVYFGFKRIRSVLYPNSLTGGQSRPLNRNGSLATIDSNMTTTYPDVKQIDTSMTPDNQYDLTQSSPATTKVRSQHLRLGLLDEDD